MGDPTDVPVGNEPVEDASADVESVSDSLHVLIIAANRFRYAMARENDVGIRDAALMAHLLDADGGLTPTELAERLMVSSGTLTAIMRRLETRNMITRRRHPDDQRAVVVTLEAAGRAASETVRGHLLSAAAALVDDPTISASTLLTYLRAASIALADETGA